ncbi:MAG: DUF433 domain-containing protein [Phycisphaerales bacterium]|nr:MAG: DUF433 domain-containing protein [Phycisphaerales bacterium]
MDWRDRIVIDPGVFCGKAVLQATRLSVEHVVRLLAQGWAEAEVLDAYPGVTRDDVLA